MPDPKPGAAENKHPQADWITVPTYTVLVEHSQLGYVLFDGTCHPEWDATPGERDHHSS